MWLRIKHFLAEEKKKKLFSHAENQTLKTYKSIIVKIILIEQKIILKALIIKFPQGT